MYTFYILKWYCRIISIFLLLFPCLSSSVQASDFPLDPEASKAWQNYDSFAKSLQGTIQKKTSSLISGSVRSYQSKYKQNANCSRICSSLGKPDVEFCTISNPLYAAEIKRQPGGGNEILRKYDPDPLCVLPSASLPVSDALFVEMSPNYCYGQRKLSDVLNDHNFKILQVEKVSQDGKSIVRFIYSALIDIPSPVKQQSRRRGMMDLDPALGWSIRAVKESEDYYVKDVLDHKSDWETRYEADMHSSGFPVMRRYTTTTTGFSNRMNKKIGARIEVDYNLSADTHVPDSEFTLSAFNLPEPIDRPTPRSSQLYLWFLLAATLCVGMSIVFRWLARRARRLQQNSVNTNLET